MSTKKSVLLHLLTIFLLAACGILVCAAQTSLLPHYLDDAFLVPDLLLCLTLGFGMLAGPIFGSLFGIYAGILADCTGGFGICLLPVFYALCGYGAHVCEDLLPNRKFPVYLAFGVLAALGRAIVAMVYVMLSSGNVELLSITRYVCIPLILGTAVALPIAFPAARLLTLPLRHMKHH